jgi:hypothetical protein
MIDVMRINDNTGRDWVPEAQSAQRFADVTLKLPFVTEAMAGN